MKIIPHLVKGDELHIAAIGDIQYGNNAFSEKALQRFLGEVKEDAQGSHLSIIGTGDYVDALSPSNRARYRATGLYSSAARRIQDEALLPLVLELHDRHLGTFGENFVALCQGHHWFQYDFNSDLEPAEAAKLQRLEDFAALTSDEHLARLFGCPLALGHALLSFEFPNKQKFNVLAWHGEGYGTTLTAGLNKLLKESAGWEDIHAIFMGHTHALSGVADTKIRYSKGEIEARNIPLINAGSYLRGYIAKETTYVEQKGLSPRALGGSMLRVRPYRKGFRTRVSLYY